MLSAQRDGQKGCPAPGLQQMHIAHGQPELAREMLAQGDVAARAPDAARLARWHLTEERLIDRVGPVRNTGDVYHEAGAGRPHVARVLPEWPFRLSHAGRHDA